MRSQNGKLVGGEMEGEGATLHWTLYHPQMLESKRAGTPDMAGKWWGEAEGVGRRPSPYTHDRPMMITMVMPEHRNTGTPGHRNTGTPEHRLLLRKPLRGLVRGAAATAVLASAGARRLLVRWLLRGRGGFWCAGCCAGCGGGSGGSGGGGRGSAGGGGGGGIG